MGTVQYREHVGYLLITRDGDMRIRRRRPYLADLGPGEYAFAIVARVPHVSRSAVAGSVHVSLPPDVDPDEEVNIDAAGPVAGPGEPEGVEA